MCIGNQRANVIPLAVEIDGTVGTDLLFNQVMDKWKHEFQTLFAEPNLPHFDNEHLDLVEARINQIHELQTILPHNEMDDNDNEYNT